MRSFTRSKQFPKLILISTMFFFVLLLIASPTSAREKWTEEEANSWYSKQPWLVGCNFSPSSAINQLEMWQEETFDPETIDRELEWAEQIGFNTVRVFLHNLLWTQDKEGFLKRFDQFLAIADKHGIGVMVVPFDGVWNPHPKLGKQHEPKPHKHNSGWIQAPGATILDDPKKQDELRPYIFELVHRYRNDNRIQVWDLFNEPDNPNHHSYGAGRLKTELQVDRKIEMSMRLIKKSVKWAYEANPSQPITIGIWRDNWSDHDKMSPYNKLAVEVSDVVSFHNYSNLEDVRHRVNLLKRYNRPILCTEYMARPVGSQFDPIMGFFKENKIGAYNWGFVEGKTQTNYPWDSWDRQYTKEPPLWFHEIFRTNGKPYDAKEVQYIKSLTEK